MQNREIKFRAWDKDCHEWVSSWDDTPIAITFEGDEIVIAWKELGCNCNPSLGTTCGGCVDVWESKTTEDGIVLSQFTGLHDRNGREVYEGDLLRFPPMSEWDRKNFSAFEVFWHDNDAAHYHIGWQMDRMHCQGNIAGGSVPQFLPRVVKEMEIIGNIFENPELLK